MRRVRGFIDLVFDVVEETTNLVERTHDAVVERIGPALCADRAGEEHGAGRHRDSDRDLGGVFESIRTSTGSPVSR